MLGGFIHHKPGEGCLVSSSPAGTDIVRVPWRRSIFLGAAIE